MPPRSKSFAVAGNALAARLHNLLAGDALAEKLEQIERSRDLISSPEDLAVLARIHAQLAALAERARGWAQRLQPRPRT